MRTACSTQPVQPSRQRKAAAAALVARGVDVQGIAVRQGGAQGRGAAPVQRLQGRQEAIAQARRRNRPRGRGPGGPGRCGSPRAGGGGDSGPARPTRSGPSRSAGREGPGRPAAARPRRAGRGSAGHCLRISRARSVPAARVTSLRVLLFCGLRGRPQSGQCRGSATKSTRGGAPSMSVARAILSPDQPASRACSRSSVRRRQAPLFRRSGGARNARTRPGPAPAGRVGSEPAGGGRPARAGSRDGGPARAARR